MPGSMYCRTHNKQSYGAGNTKLGYKAKGPDFGKTLPKPINLKSINVKGLNVQRANVKITKGKLPKDFLKV